jgi:preprotein translocase subunit YajC|tara:strand:+ start:2348 stop:2707 length:360 start_codon:yes stop_codon:yes gene_type:complete
MRRNIVSILGAVVALSASVVFIGSCAVPAEGAEGGSNWTLIIFLGLMFVMFYFLMIRPQRKRQKEHQQLMAELKRGDRVVTAGGIFGVIESLSEDSIIIKVESGATMRVARGSVALKQE